MDLNKSTPNTDMDFIVGIRDDPFTNNLSLSTEFHFGTKRHKYFRAKFFYSFIYVKGQIFLVCKFDIFGKHYLV